MESATDRPQIVLSQIDPSLKGELMARLGNLDLGYCFQCGMCSGSCPTVTRMEYGPRRIMHMVRLGLIDQILRSDDIWFCVSCFTCAARCPQGIEITDVMSALRNMALDKGTAKDEEATFSRTFVEVLRNHGRMHETEVLLRYYTGKPGLSALKSILQQAGLGLNMFRKGKIALRAENIAQTGEVNKIVAQIQGGKKR